MAALLLAAQCPNSNQYAVVLTASPTSGTSPLTVNFDASSSFAPEGSIIMCEWDFGDGGTGTTVTETISHTYLHPGVYMAELTACDTEGNCDSDSCMITVTAAIGTPPSANFTATRTSGQAPLAVSFNGSSSSDSDGSITSYAWSFGDGGSSSGVTANHTYSSAGVYTAQLTVTDNDGATDTATRTIQVSATPGANNPPIASFTASPTSGQAPLTVSFDASSSSDPDGSISRYNWDFADGRSEMPGVTVSRTFNRVEGGYYNVKLTVTDNDGASDTATKMITVTASDSFHAEVISYSWSVQGNIAYFSGVVENDGDTSIDQIGITATVYSRFSPYVLGSDTTTVYGLEGGRTSSFSIIVILQNGVVSSTSVKVTLEMNYSN